ncbi:MAG: N-acetyl-gamma-glutamyl-phosphate reductase [Bacteroidales bacterium]|nr:N-acetyl-gamma-glutamyl-phosphate reductase [Bacteroidales bacterium]
MKKVAIIGATGYTGSELVRILTFHDQVQIELITSETYQGKKFSDIHPQFKGICDVELKSADDAGDYQPDLVFLALPHGVAMEYVKNWKDKPFKIIDLSGDFRLRSPKSYYTWYNIEHSYPEGFDDAVFGLPELYRERIARSRLVANPGCFPTGAILGAYPLLREHLIQPDRIFIDSKTGVTGAGVKPKAVTHFPNVNDNFKAYGIENHRHTIEIQEILSSSSGKQSTVQFTPHLLPVDRGILTSIYSIPAGTISNEEVKELYHRYYDREPFIRIRNVPPEIKQVRGTNYTDIAAFFDERTGNMLVFTAIDNLVKGAAGQAVQNMNLMLGFDEKEALEFIPIMP